MSEALVIMVVSDCCTAGRSACGPRPCPQEGAPAAPCWTRRRSAGWSSRQWAGPPGGATSDRRRRHEARSRSVSPCSATRPPQPPRPQMPFAGPPPRPPTNCSSDPVGTPIRSGPTPGRRRSARWPRPRAQAAELRAGLESERNRITLEATAALAEDRKELQEAEQRLRAATQALADEQQALVADRRRIGSEQGELTDTKRSRCRPAPRQLAATTAELTGRARRSWTTGEQELASAAAAQQAELVRISGLTTEAARAELLAGQEEAVRRDAAMMIRRIEIGGAELRQAAGQGDRRRGDPAGRVRPDRADRRRRRAPARRRGQGPDHRPRGPQHPRLRDRHRRQRDHRRHPGSRAAVLLRPGPAGDRPDHPGDADRGRPDPPAPHRGGLRAGPRRGRGALPAGRRGRACWRSGSPTCTRSWSPSSAG